MVRDWWLDRRNALLSSPRFQRLASRLRPMRGPARVHARRLFDLVAGFTYSQTLAACVELGLIDLLAERPRSIAEVASASRLSDAAATRLVDAATAIGLLQRRRDGRVTLGVAGAALAGNPGVAAMVRHHRLLYADLADPVALLRREGGGGALARFWAYAQGDDPAAVADYSALMAASHAPVAEQVLDAYPVGRHRRLLDIGGGEGRFAEAVRARAPALEIGLLDLPAVIDRARPRLGDVVTLHPGDCIAGPLPTGYDCISLIRVLHDHDDGAALAILRNVHAALPAGGVVLIGEPMAEAAGAASVGPTYFGWYLLAMGQGRARSASEIVGLLKQAGFNRMDAKPTALPLIASVMVGVKTD